MAIQPFQNFFRYLKLIGFIVILLWFQQAQSQDMEFDWAKQASGNGEEFAEGIAVDSSGNVCVTGHFRGSITFGSTTLTTAGYSDIYIAKYDGSGNLQWATQAGGTVFDTGFGIAADGSGNIYVTGYFSGTSTFGSTTLTTNGSNDVFIAKIDESGNFLWTKQAGGSGLDNGYGITVDVSGNVYITGYFTDNATFGSISLTSNGAYDIFIVKLDASGNFLWAKHAGGSSYDYGKGIAVDRSGNVYLTGYFMETATFGSTTLTSAGSYDIFIAKCNTSGDFLWAKQAGGSSSDSYGDKGVGIAVDGSGNIYATGYFIDTATFESTILTSAGSYDIFISKYNTSGIFLWAKKAGGSSFDRGYGIAVDGSGNPYVTGEFCATAIFGSTSLTASAYNDVFIAKMDGTGNFLWIKQAGGSEGDVGDGIAIDVTGNVFVTGDFRATAVFGSISLVCGGDEGIFICKLKQVITLPPPTSLVALDGYDHAVPLAWKAPSDVSSNNPVQGYSIRRSNPDGSHNHIDGNGTRTYFRDTTVENGGTYSYLVRAVYANGQSDYSNNVQGNPQTGGYVIQLAFPSTLPTIDGVLGSGEWSGAGTVEVTYPGDFGPVTLYAFNDASALYVAVDNTRDHARHTNDGLGLFFDENLDREWPLSAPSSEGILQLYWNGTSATCAYEGLHGYWPDHIGGETWTTPAGVTQGVSASSGHVQFEGRIPFSTFLQTSPGSTIGMLLYVYEGQTSSFDGLWPQEVVVHLPSYTSGNAWAHGPFSYGDLVLNNSTTQTRNVTFRVTVPSNTPSGDVVYLAGNFSSWNAAGNAMTKTGTNKWEVTLPFAASQALEYKYTRGTWTTVEKGAQGEEISDRTLTVPGSDCIVNDTVLKWADLTSVDSDHAGTITEFKLCANYPNPFNPRTTIRFELPQASRVILKVIDCLGREVVVLADEEYSEGIHDVSFESKNRNSGIFIYTLTAQGRDGHVVFQETRKGLMLK